MSLGLSINYVDKIGGRGLEKFGKRDATNEMLFAVNQNSNHA